MFRPSLSPSKWAERTKSRFSKGPIIAVWKGHAAVVGLAGLSRKHVIGVAPCCAWGKRCVGMEASDAKRLSALDYENVRREKLGVERVLGAMILREAVTT